MRILLIDNSAITVKDGRKFTNAFNGQFISELISLGHTVVCFQFAAPSINSINSFDLELCGAQCFCQTMYNSTLKRYLCALFNAIKAIIKSDFVYIYYPNSFKIVALLCYVLKKPYGIYIRGMNGVNNRVSYFIYKHAFTVLTVSDWFTNMVKCAVNNNNVYTIRPMIPYTDVDVVGDRHYESKDDYSILFLGRIAKEKGLEELVLATEQLLHKDYHFHLRIVGDGEYLDDLSRLINDRNLSQTISIEGAVFDKDKKANYFYSSDIYVLPTYHEGFPRTLYEAMIFGTPIITTFVGGIPALMKDGENCVRIDPHSSNSIVSALSFAMDNYPLMGNMAKEASTLVSTIVDRKRLTHAQQLNNILSSNHVK